MEKFKDKLPWFGLTAVACIAALYLLSFLAFTFINAIQTALYQDYYAADGPFQLYNPLRRLLDGQISGVDFQFFHGLAVPLIHFPVFAYMGGNIFASEFSRAFISPVLMLSSTLLFFYALLRSLRWSLIATSLAIMVTVYTWTGVIYPGNSLISVRTTAPLLFAAAFLLGYGKFATIRQWRIPLDRVLPGVMAAVALLLGTEQGLALCLAYIAVLGVRALANRKTFIPAVINIGWFVWVTAAAFLSLMALITGGRPLKALLFNFKDVSTDQSWYFGTQPNLYLNWSNLGEQLGTRYLYYSATAIGLVLVLLLIARKLKAADPKHVVLFCTLLAYGVIVFVIGAIGGYFDRGQALPIMRVGIISAIGLLIMIAVKLYHKKTPLLHKIRPYVATLVMAGLVVLLGDYLYNSVNGVRSFPVRSLLAEAEKARRQDDTTIARNSLWGSRLDKFQPYIKEKDAAVWSTYANLHESSVGKFNPSADGFDYIIHALGKEKRDAYAQQFIASKPKYAITLKQDFFIYEEWLWQRHWPLYERLISNYTLISETNSHYLWEYSGEKTAPRTTPIAIAAEANGEYRLPAVDAAGISLYKVQVDYEISPPNFYKKIPRYQLDVKDSALHFDVGLPSYLNQWEFVVPIVKSSKQPVIKPYVDGLTLGGNKLKITGMTAELVTPLAESNLRPFINSACEAIKEPAIDCKLYD